VTLWRATAALSRALILSGLGLALAALFGEPVLVVLVAPLAVCAGLGLAGRPRTEPGVETRVGHSTLHEGQGTTFDVTVTGDEYVEQVTRVVARTAYVALRPSRGVVATRLLPDVDPAPIAVSPRRWGRLDLGEERVGLTSRWAGFRWGPVASSAQPLTSLPTTAPFDSRAEVPQPIGLVGAHRSRRVGGGTEFAGIRPFAAGDRLRRIDWRVSLRTGDLHVVDTLAEQDAGVLVVVDALAELGRSGGLDGAESSLDVTVRAAAALAEHHIRSGDRVSLRVVGGGAELVGFGAGARHLRVISGTLARVRPGVPRDLPAEGLNLGATAGTIVMILSPMLHDSLVAAAALLTRRGLPTLVIDTLPPDLVPGADPGIDPVVAALAWRMRRAQRDLLLERLAGTGCPVVPWRGPGTLDDVLRRLARRAQLPQVRVR
jgi:uncharacterized protein (DUF58 family)